MSHDICPNCKQPTFRCDAKGAHGTTRVVVGVLDGAGRRPTWVPTGKYERDGKPIMELLWGGTDPVAVQPVSLLEADYTFKDGLVVGVQMRTGKELK